MGENNKINKYEKFIPENEEIRCGFKVSSNRKKVRNVELGLLEELKKICKKHNIKYYADGGTLLGAIRHKGFIPRDDDIDVVMFREDFDKFLKIAKKDLPKHIKLWTHYCKFAKIVNENTTAICDEHIGGIRIDIFAVDNASKFTIINKIKAEVLETLVKVAILQETNRSTNKVKKWKIPFVYVIRFICTLCKIDNEKIRKIRENINRTVFFKGKDIYTAGCAYNFFPKSIYDKSHIGKFENTTINIADGYDTFLKILYGDYTTPVIYQGGHKCRYSVDKSYKDIIKSFDNSKSNEENCKNCKDLFLP